MSKTGTWTMAAGGFVLLIFMAGFFFEEARPSGSPPVVCAKEPMAPACVPPPPACEVPKPADIVSAGKPAPSLKPQGLLAMTNSPSYKRAGDLTLRVADCTKAEDDLESKLVSIKGEIIDMVMEGTEGSRTCTLSAVIPADQFRAFIVELRKMGKVQSERITASKLRPGQAEGSAAVGGPDPRELSLVSVRMADEKVAQTVLESRGVLATSFDRSASHFMKGLAVIVELVGLALPFLLALAAVAIPALVVLKLRRPRPAGI
jgi:hypothetical protein